MPFSNVGIQPAGTSARISSAAAIKVANRTWPEADRRIGTVSP
jgi:hypothetical protein